jgi:ABC-type transport system involved in multi-copper enzyme maturation permease subunit
VTNMGKGKPFLEVLASAIHEDYRFPFLELFAFLYILGTFALSNFTASVYTTAQVTTEEGIAYSLASSLISGSLIVFILLIFKNIAYGLGNELEKGIIQTYFSYPLKRRGILTAKLLSAIGVALLLFLGIQISALYMLAPDIVLPHLDTVILTYAANLGYPLLISAIMLLMTLKLRRGGIGLVVGIVLYFAMSIVALIAFFVAVASESPLILQILSAISPTYALQYHYGGGLSGVSALFSVPWAPTLSETLLYVGANYVIVASLFALAYIYFSRRLNL